MWGGKLRPRLGLATAFRTRPAGTEGLGLFPTLGRRRKQRGKSPMEGRAERLREAVPAGRAGSAASSPPSPTSWSPPWGSGECRWCSAPSRASPLGRGPRWRSFRSSSLGCFWISDLGARSLACLFTERESAVNFGNNSMDFNTTSKEARTVLFNFVTIPCKKTLKPILYQVKLC